MNERLLLAGGSLCVALLLVTRCLEPAPEANVHDDSRPEAELPAKAAGASTETLCMRRPVADPVPGLRIPSGAKVKLPLVLRDVESTGAELNAITREVIENLRTRFTAQMSTIDPSVSDEEYSEQWADAQRDADEALQASLGTQLYQELHIRAWGGDLARN